MGIKYASIHVLDTTVKDIVSILKQRHENNNVKLLNCIFDINTEYYILQNTNSISIFSEDFSFDNINDEALAILGGNYFEYITVGFYEGDLLEIAYFVDDAIISRIVIGEGIKEYGFNAQIIDISSMLNRFGLDEEMFFLCYSKDLKQMCNNISKAISLPLDKTYDDIEGNESAYKIQLC